MTGDNGEFATAAAMDFVAVALTFSSGEIYEAGGGEFIKRDAAGVGGDIGALGLRDLCEVHANAGEADGLCWSGSRIRDGHFLYVEIINATHDEGCDKDKSERSHETSLAQLGERDKGFCGYCAGNFVVTPCSNSVPQFSARLPSAGRICAKAVKSSATETAPGIQIDTLRALQ